MTTVKLRELIDQNEGPLLDEWTNLQASTMKTVRERITPPEIRRNSHDFLVSLKHAR